MRPGLTSVLTTRPDGTQPRWLGTLGHVSPAVYSYTVPGGCSALTCTLRRPPKFRTDALAPGRIVEAYRGGAPVWAGILDEPVPSADGWALSAHGAAAQAADYRAVWTGTYSTSTPDQVVNNAIGAGLPWRNPGIGSPAGMWIGQAFDSGSQTVADVLNLICNKGGLTWSVVTTAAGNTLTVFALPTAANRLLVAGGPVARSVATGATMIRIRYQASADSGATKATYALTSVTDTARDAQQGHTEDFMDISSAGVYTAGQAQAIGNQVLKRFVRAAFTDPFTVRLGGLLNMGGQPADPGVFYAEGQTAMVCRVLLADLGYAGDIATGPVQFTVGEYSWDDGACVATVTPMDSFRHDWGSLMSAAADTAPVRAAPASRLHVLRGGRRR